MRTWSKVCSNTGERRGRPPYKYRQCDTCGKEYEYRKRRHTCPCGGHVYVRTCPGTREEEERDKRNMGAFRKAYKAFATNLLSEKIEDFEDWRDFEEEFYERLNTDTNLTPAAYHITEQQANEIDQEVRSDVIGRFNRWRKCIAQRNLKNSF